MSKKVELTAEQQVAETATLAIAAAMNAQTSNQIAIGRLFNQAVVAGYPKLLGYETVKLYAAARFDWAYSTIAQFVTVAKLGELVGWSDAELMTVGVNGKCISALMMIGAAVKREPAATKLERANKLLNASVGKSLNHIDGLCRKNSKIGEPTAGRRAAGKKGAAGGGDDTPLDGSATIEARITIEGDVAERFLAYMTANGIDPASMGQVNGFFADLLDMLETDGSDTAEGMIPLFEQEAAASAVN